MSMHPPARLHALLEDVRRELDAYTADSTQDNYRAVQHTIRRLQAGASSPADTLFTFRFQIVEHIGVMMLLELGILDALAKHEGESEGVTAKELASETGVEESLVVRLLRLGSALHFIDHPTSQTYLPNPITTSLVRPGWKAALAWMELIYPVAGQIRSFLSTTHFGRTGQSNTSTSTPAGPAPTPFTFGHGGKSLWQVMDEQPEHKRNFDLWIQERKKYDETRWVARYPPLATLRSQQLLQKQPQEPQQGNNDTVFMVDVGGISAVQLGRLRTQLPELQGRCILQVPPDKANVMNQTAEGVEVMTYDLATEQPVKGARFYYLNNIFHNLPDSACISILRTLLPALKPGYSTILIDDYVLATHNTPLRSAVTDIHVMAMFNAADRTGEQYERIFAEAAGGEGGRRLEVTGWYPAGVNDECVIELGVVGSD
ncbi:hypothetical protein B0J18DRAFT_416808 [Chaetomium sp. MPI-SDFR-AT-0129]|nr:hypothetical protein B0J18DRAFT_416808 [Chaetomium sp. MPI-SDFR-AT-0129]